MNICAVGDGDQNIYNGAGEPANILNFEMTTRAHKRFFSRKTIVQHKLFSPPQTVSSKIPYAKKKSFTRNIEGTKSRLLKVTTKAAKREQLGKIKGLIDSGTDPEDIAILYRAISIARTRELFPHYGNSYQVLGVRFSNARK